jgi:hypothetical protein
MRHVNVYVDQPSCIELHLRETVRLERLTPTADGYVAEPHGTLLAPGVTQVPLEPGLYHLRTLEDAELRVIAGGVQVTSPDTDGSKQPPGAGQGPCGRVPALRKRGRNTGHVNVDDQFHDLVTRLAAADGTVAEERAPEILDTALAHEMLEAIVGGHRSRYQDPYSPGCDVKIPAGSGHGPCGRVPTLRVVDATAGVPEARRPCPPHRRRGRRETCDHHAREGSA